MKTTKKILENKHFGEKVRTFYLDSDRFDLPQGDIIFPKSGILTRYEDGTVGVSIHFMGEKEGSKRFGHWLQEKTDSTSIKEWAEQHTQITVSVAELTTI